MALLVTSTRALTRGGKPYPPAIDALGRVSTSGDPAGVGVVSRHPCPDWWEVATAGTDLAFVRDRSRGDGSIIDAVAKQLKVEPHRLLVLAADRMDVAMAKHGRAMLLNPGWIDPEAAKNTGTAGIRVDTPKQLEEVAGCLDRWSGGWHWGASLPQMEVRALFDASTFGNVTHREASFKRTLTDLVKTGGERSSALAAFLSRSILDKIPPTGPTAFALVPSSSSNNDDSDPLSGTLHAVRTATSQVHFARRGEPILERTEPTAPRNKQKNADRTDPVPQIDTVRVSPAYRGKLVGRTVYLLDDFTTHGVSFNVGRALLLAAGAQQVNPIAFGKFGGSFRFQDIRLETKSDCYKAGPKPHQLGPREQPADLCDSRPHAEFEKAFTDAHRVRKRP